MPRPRRRRNIEFDPTVVYFKPRGIPLKRLSEVVLERDELEALKLHDGDNLDHISASKKMGISQPTFGRILDSAYRKITDALINGRAIRIHKE